MWRTPAATAEGVKVRESAAWNGSATTRVYKGGLWSSNDTLGGGGDGGSGGWGDGTANLTTWYGSSLGYSNYAGNLDNFGALDLTRTYSSGQPGGWNWSNVPNDAKAGMGSTSYVSWYSFKLSAQSQSLLAGGTSAGKTALLTDIRGFFASIPTNYRVLISVHHEPEDNVQNGDFTAADWRAWNEAIMAQCVAAREARSTNKNWLKFSTCLMGWTFDTDSGRNPENYRVDSVDMWGYDAYKLGTQRFSAQYAIDHGKAWGYGEVGNRQNGTDTQMYDMLRQGIEQWTTRTTKPKVVAYWQATAAKAASCWEIVLWPTAVGAWKSGCDPIPARPNTLRLWQKMCQDGKLSAPDV